MIVVSQLLEELAKWSRWFGDIEHGPPTCFYWGLHSDNKKGNGSYYIVCWGYIGMMRKWKLLYSVLGLYWNNGKEHGDYYVVYWGYIGILEKHVSYDIVYWGCIGVMEKNMETTIQYIGVIQG